jgi:MoxR-like ATPase
VPQDVKDVAGDILRHRMALSYRAEAEGLSSDDLIERILATVPIAEE